MRITVTNIGPGPRVCHPKSGLRILDPGHSITAEFSEGEVLSAMDNPDLRVVELAEHAPASKSPAAELLAQVDDMPFMAFKAKARELLGDACPSRKAEIIAALEAL